VARTEGFIRTSIAECAFRSFLTLQEDDSTIRLYCPHRNRFFVPSVYATREMRLYKRFSGQRSPVIGFPYIGVSSKVLPRVPRIKKVIQSVSPKAKEERRLAKEHPVRQRVSTPAKFYFHRREKFKKVVQLFVRGDGKIANGSKFIQLFTNNDHLSALVLCHASLSSPNSFLLQSTGRMNAL